ncbi:hypothetical protein [Streptomyces harbinensis]|uniref:Uncharacterized protein n=1 Tax=Streptomyces harbinensis TaxID=1176198 RepID=A0A1I6WCV0_9ACTN|nr:hypothetical protein [Streptomyces harbinensis]SFT23571.1 hypothetical protein SAMN05444716_1195 [Streptomyces harbinensis]
MKPARTERDRERKIARAKKRVTADLPTADYARLGELRRTHRASTTDLVRGYLHMHETDPDMGAKLTSAIMDVRMSDLQASARTAA